MRQNLFIFLPYPADPEKCQPGFTKCEEEPKICPGHARTGVWQRITGTVLPVYFSWRAKVSEAELMQ
jgi:hypothetical protein